MLVKDIIVQERRRQGISAIQLADRVGITPATLSRYESGAIKMISKDSLLKIADALNYDFDDLVAGDPKYCALASPGKSKPVMDLSDDDRSLLLWYHDLPQELQNLVKQMFNLRVAMQ